MRSPQTGRLYFFIGWHTAKNVGLRIKQTMSTPIYGFNEGYSLSASPVSQFVQPSRMKMAQVEQLYTPNIINLNPMPGQPRSITIGQRSYALGPGPQSFALGASGNGPHAATMCANLSAVANQGASLCLDPQTNMCAPPPVPNQCPRGHVALNQFSGALSSAPRGVTYGMMTP
jgi:hypothetical protein